MRRMMVDIPIPPKWKALWNTWDLRGFIILSLSLQSFLIIVAPMRNRIKSKWVMVPLWSAYLLADWAANFAVGLISNSQANPSAESGKKFRFAVENEDLLAFWAPFLLVHLGGPDTITAFALEDNELWLRHLLGLVFQCLAAVYVFVQSLPQNRLWIPTMLMFLTGIIKYAERTRSLYLASADRFKDSLLEDPDAGPNYAKLMDEYQSKKEANLPTRIQMVPEPADRAAKSANKAKKGRLTELEVVQYGYHFFNTFKGLVVDMIFSRRERNQSRDFFLNRNAEDAFKVVEVELNFLYDVLFTKLPVVFGKTARGNTGAISRIFSLATVCSATVLFIFKSKSNFTAADVTITYGLLFGALVLDMTALIMLLFSDWTIISIISIRESPDIGKSCMAKFFTAFFRLSFFTLFLRLRTEGTPKDTKYDLPRNEKQSRKGRMKWLKRRWSESVSTYNLINYCLHPHRTKVICEKLGFSSEFLDGIFHVKHKEFTPLLRNFIFQELKSKSELGDDLETAKEISSARGDWVLRVEEGWSSLLTYVLDVDYDQSLILWHITTELCYNEELHEEYKLKACENRNTDHREISKLLSDYMLYLLILQPSLMSAVAGIGQIRFRDTCAEATRFFNERNVKETSTLEELTKGLWDKDIDLMHVKACKEILNVSTDVDPVTLKGDQSKSLLFDGCILAKKLMKIEREEKDKKLNKWLIISKVWVELLCYGASHSRANVQAAQVSNGGELITIVWLLMTHFGLGEQFQINEGQARAKLIVGK